MHRLPGSQKVLFDAIEWYAHSIFLEDSTEADILHASEQIDHLCCCAFPAGMPRAGRLWNRILMSMLVQNICTQSPKSLHGLSPDEWRHALLNLQECRASLLKSNASTFPPEGHDKTNDELVELPMFQEVYREVQDLITCHVVLSEFRLALLQKGNHSHSNDDDDNNNNNNNNNNQDELTQILNNFTKSIPTPFYESLVPSLAKDVLSSPKRSTDVRQKLLADVEQLLLGHANADAPFSYATLQSKCKTLCRTWNECILGIPTLAKLGYGGIRKSRFQQEEGGEETKTVSSWGMDEQDEAEDLRTNDSSEDTSEEPLHSYFTTGSPNQRKSKNYEISKEVPPLEIRPRESWKEDFTMIENLNDDDDDDDDGHVGKTSHVRQVTAEHDDPILRAARQRRQQRRRRRQQHELASTRFTRSSGIATKFPNTRSSARTRTASAPSTTTPKAPRRRSRSSSTASIKSSRRTTRSSSRLKRRNWHNGDATDDENNDSYKKRPRRAFTEDQVKALKRGVAIYGDHAWDLILFEAGTILGDKKPWQCRDYYETHVLQKKS